MGSSANNGSDLHSQTTLVSGVRSTREVQRLTLAPTSADTCPAKPPGETRPTLRLGAREHPAQGASMALTHPRALLDAAKARYQRLR